MHDVGVQVAYVAEALAREITTMEGGHAEHSSWRIEQRCPVCEVFIAVTFREREIEGVEWLFNKMFELYDEHRCQLYRPIDVLRERAEQESERIANRAAVLRAREAAAPIPHGLPSLYERAERESVVLAEWAARFA